MQYRADSLFLINDLSDLQKQSEQIATKITGLLNRLSPLLEKNSLKAGSIVGLLDENSRLASSLKVRANQRAYIWFPAFVSNDTYAKILETIPNAVFFHGEKGLWTLTTYLEEAGFIDADAQADPLAEDAFLKMRGEYLCQIEEDLDVFLNPGAGAQLTIPECESLLNRIVGSAGTYEFDLLAQSASSVLESSQKGETINPTALIERLSQTVSDERNLYERRIQECLPTEVELNVRHRVLAVSDDPIISKQLQFALSHSRMHTTIVSEPENTLSNLEEIQPDILVLQQRLKHFDGFDIAAHVRTEEKFQALPVLALLDESTENAITRAVRGQVDTWLTIPFSASNVALTVLNLLHRVDVARRLGGRDSLTGLYTKESMLDRLKTEILRTSRSGQQIGVVLIHLKNTESPRKDFVELLNTAQKVFRRSDLLARYNETTLAAVLPGIDARGIIAIFNRLRHLLDERLSYETAAALSDGPVAAESLLADVEVRLTRVLKGSDEPAIGIYAPVEEVIKGQRTAPQILIADADDAIVNVLKFFCAREGFEPIVIQNGTDVLDYLEKENETDSLPDLVVLESFLPGADGFQILEKIQSDFGGRPAAIMMGVRPSEERIARAFSLGVIDFAIKPFKIPEIVARIRNALSRAGIS